MKLDTLHHECENFLAGNDYTVEATDTGQIVRASLNLNIAHCATF